MVAVEGGWNFVYCSFPHLDFYSAACTIIARLNLIEVLGLLGSTTVGAT
jgi:hypothetical protein